MNQIFIKVYKFHGYEISDKILLYLLSLAFIKYSVTKVFPMIPVVTETS